ncbi:hypothetical protein GA0115240_144818 [Streptomyces sp. DvalAA-14]|uniref:hypothetical protein n=1 Tax=unclassified Streptomyces TaxID=2593676 RepID=UPI00081B6166|nr:MULTISPECIES: hypothetical protein [unclassified Streptomyces]MYS22770.1 hypothetical protein [Streptomyces sp. SID4948]SCE22200.1 hypothetical protein GA0115240_144818 [Streptomyces sp. DvalAA-14]
MSIEATVGVRLAADTELGTLLADIEAAHRRAVKSAPGERVEIVGYETLCAALEAKAAARLLLDRSARTPAPDLATSTAGLFVRRGAEVIVALRLPLEPGEVRRSVAGVAAPAPASPVEMRDDIHGRRLVEARFREQLEAAIAEPGRDRSSVMSPSGVHNRVLTEVLWQFAGRQEQQPVRVPVVYRDGSRAEADFPLRCLTLVDELRDSAQLDLELRLTLLSIRHTEMDPVVDGAWLRNSEVSRPRPAAQTDDFVYRTSVSQLDVLTQQGTLNVRLYIFQTGLETAVVGFFRAVVEFLGRHPGRLEVVPMFYAADAGGSVGVEEEFASFASGQVWATKR